jgi:tripartite-type tricarboxylate transporter receptor subunit TctC
LWDSYTAVNETDGIMLRMICLPPGTPAAARSSLAAAVAKLNADKEHAAEAMNTIGFVPEWQVGPSVDPAVDSALSLPPKIRSFLTDYIKAANK